MKKKTCFALTIVCSLIACCSFLGGAITAFAMVKDAPVAKDVLTEDSVFNGGEWAYDGATAEETFSVVSYGERIALYDYANSHFGHIIPFTEFYADGTVEFTIDVYGASELWFYLSDATDGVAGENYWCPRLFGYDDYACIYFQEKNGKTTYNQFKTPVYDGDVIVGWEPTVSGYYADKDRTETISNPSYFSYFGVRYNVKYYTDSPSIYYSWTPIDREGNCIVDQKTEFFTLSSEGALKTDRKYYAGIQISAVSDKIPSTFDNVSIKNGETELIPDYTTDNLDWCINEIPADADGSVFVGHYGRARKVDIVESKEMVLKNGKNTDKLYAYDKLVYDKNVDAQFKFSGKFQFREDYDVNKAFGVAFGLNSPSQDVNSSSTTLVAFENRMYGNNSFTEVVISENESGTGYIIPLQQINISRKLETSFDIKSFSRFIAYLAPTSNYFTGNAAYYDAGIFVYNNGKLNYTRSNSSWLYKETNVTRDGSSFTYGSSTFGSSGAIMNDVSHGLNVKITFYSNDYLTPTNEYSVIEYLFTPYDENGNLDDANALHVYAYGGNKTVTSDKNFHVGLQVSGIDEDNPVVLDNVVIENFNANGTVKLLNKTWDNMTSDVNCGDENKVFVGFRTGGGTVLPSLTTCLVVYEGGEEISAVPLGFNAVGLDYIDYSFTAFRDGSITAVVNGVPYGLTFNKDNVSGYIALALKDNFDNMQVAIKDVEIRRYSYKESEESAIATNFNTGYVDPSLWTMQSTTSVKTKPEYADKVNGLVLQDGKLKFDGTTDKAYFSTLYDYGDFILEFELEEFFDGLLPDKSDSDKPKLVDEWVAAHGYSALYVNFGVISGNGVGSSCMLGFIQQRANADSPFKGTIVLQDYKSGGVNVSKPIDYNFYPQQSGVSKNTAVKIICSVNTITIFVQEILPDVELSVDRWVQIAQFDGITDTFGRIAFTSTEAGWFNLDNIRIYPIDDPNPARINAKIALFEDFAEIPDTLEPYELTAPVITFNDGVVSWEKVNGATGYIVKCNGFTRELNASQNSYKFNVNGEYTVVVIARGNGAEILDSAASNELQFNIGGAGAGSNIWFLIGGAAIAVVSVSASVAAFTVLKKKRIPKTI